MLAGLSPRCASARPSRVPRGLFRGHPAARPGRRRVGRLHPPNPGRGTSDGSCRQVFEIHAHPAAHVFTHARLQTIASRGVVAVQCRCPGASSPIWCRGLRCRKQGYRPARATNGLSRQPPRRLFLALAIQSNMQRDTNHPSHEAK